MHFVFDLDGTLANIEHRLHYVSGASKNWREFFQACVYDTPNAGVCAAAMALGLLESEHNIEVWSGRSDEVRQQSEKWLKEQGLSYRKLRMRRSGDHRPDVVVKEEWLVAYCSEHGKAPDLVFDDRKVVVDMWRRCGVMCAQVAPGDF